MRLRSDLDRPILRLAVPSIAASLSVPIIGFADTILVGHLDAVSMLGAVSVGAVVFDVIFWGLGFFRMGTTALVAQAFGARDTGACRAILLQSAAGALGLGCLLILLRGPIGLLGFGLAGPSPEVVAFGRAYLEVRILGAPLVLVTFVLTGFFRGCGDAVSPLWITILVNVVNVVLDYALIYGAWGAPALGVVGAAWASVAASASGLVLGAVILVRRYRWVTATRGGGGSHLRRIASTNGFLFGRTACLLFTQFFGLAVVSRLGDGPLAAHAIAWQIWSVVSYFVDGFAHAAETLVGNAVGAGDSAGARAFGRRSITWGVAIGGLFAVAYVPGVEPLARVFTDHVEVAATVAGLWLFLALIQPLSGAVYILDGILIGADDTRFLFAAMVAGAFLVYLPAVLLATDVFGYGLAGVWAAYNALMAARFGCLAPRFRGKKWLSRSPGHFA